ncbi:MAG: hypothetical protein ABEK16_03715 [Candidatus Nanohalobium sp.]
MKFQLFERLRDDDSGNNSSTSGGPQSQGLGEPQMNDSGLQGGGLERTVENMFDQGYSEEEIRDELQGQYSEQEIQQAVNNTVASNATDSGGPEPMTPYQSDDEPVSPMDEGYGGDGEGDMPAEQDDGNQDMPPQNPPQQQQQMQQPPQQDMQNQQMPGGQQGPPGQGGQVDSSVEELIETIVAENFQRVTAEFQNVYEELDTIEEEIESLEKRVHDLEVRDDEDQEQFVQKVEEMEDHIDQYQSRIGGLEKAFQQVLPNLVDNVRDLTQLVQEIKQEKGIETSTDISQQEMDDMDQLEDW